MEATAPRSVSFWGCGRWNTARTPFMAMRTGGSFFEDRLQHKLVFSRIDLISNHDTRMTLKTCVFRPS